MGLGIIYKITCKDTNNVYYGSTTDKLCRRKSGHIQNVKSYDEGKTTRKCSSYQILKNNNYSFEKVEELVCETKQELLYRERFYIENNECVNKNLPICSKEEAKESKKLWSKEYVKNEEVKERKKKEWNKYYNNRNEEQKEKKKERDRIYREKNREKINQQKREAYATEEVKEKARIYNEKNREKINQKKREAYAESKKH
jgi:hypothetical protein